MIKKQITMSKHRMPVPISLLIKTTNNYSCNIFIIHHDQLINAKKYDDMQRKMGNGDLSLTFFFDGSDEADAEQHIEQLFRA